MCGISGIYNAKGVNEELNNIFIPVLNHRGPDASGVFYNGKMALYHNRLSILDLSEAANQPFFSANGRYVMVYNGEIYNYKELAAEVLKNTYPGFNFRTTSDTEVIIEAFALWGPDFVKKLNGMFSFCIYDIKENVIFLYRDRLGIKPLFYSFDGARLVFSSELKSFIAYKEHRLTINERALSLYLHQGFIPPPFTVYNEVKKVFPGQYLVLKEDKLSVNTYWSLKNKILPDHISDESTALKQLTYLVESSVDNHLVSDVPVGVFLSGGVDSSLITALAVKVSPLRINTFSIGFEENKFNESQYASKIAKYLNTNHHEYILSYKSALGLIDNLTEVYDEPFADSSAIPTMLVSHLARQKVKVTLSGDGGDELFMGYGAYRWAKRLQNPMLKRSRKMIHKMLSSASGKRKQRASNYFNYSGDTFLPSHILSQEQNLFSAEETRMLMRIAPHTEMMRNKIDIENLNRQLSPVEEQAFFDLHYYLPADLLTKVDRASMCYSLETRVPYLDHRIVEMAINLDQKLKLNKNTTKYLLKKILYQHLPQEFFNRPKQGFAIPLENWMSNELKEFVNDYLSEETIKKAGLIKNPHMVEKLKKQYYGGRTYLYNRLWSLALLHKWYLKNGTARI